MGDASIITAFPLDKAGLEYLLEPYNVRCPISWWTENGDPFAVMKGPGTGYRIGEPDWRQIYILPSEPEDSGQDYNLIRRRLGSRFRPVEPASSILVAYGYRPPFSSRPEQNAHGYSFEEWNALPMSNHGWEMVLELAYTLAHWAPTVIDNHTIDGLYHLERGQWVPEGPGYIYDMAAGVVRRP